MSYVTPWSGILAEGTYRVEMPASVISGTNGYIFKQWEDGSTNPIRVVNLTSDKSVSATYIIGGDNMANVTFTGTVSAQAAAGETVTIKVSQAGTIIDTLTALTLADKSYSTTPKQYNAGAYTVQAHVDADAGYLAADSTVVSYTVTKSTRTITVVATVA